jgi:hypothetical protein
LILHGPDILPGYAATIWRYSGSVRSPQPGALPIWARLARTLDQATLSLWKSLDPRLRVIVFGIAVSGSNYPTLIQREF